MMVNNVLKNTSLEMYTIKLPNFEGPLDLLLFFIKRDELDIYDIPIARITREFLDFIRLMQLFDLELAGEFLVMASSLMQIKVRMLLPKAVDDSGEELPGEDPRNELVQQLLQYSQYKEVSREFSSREDAQRYVYYRQVFDADAIAESEEEYKNATLFDLLAAFKKALERRPAQITLHTVQLYPITIEEQTENILMRIRTERRLSFMNLVSEKPRLYIVVTFLAMLEMSKNQIISIRQNENFDDIEIVPYEDIIETKLLEEVLHPLHIVSSDDTAAAVVDEHEMLSQMRAEALSAEAANSEVSDSASTNLDDATSSQSDVAETVAALDEKSEDASDDESEEDSEEDSEEESDDDSEEDSEDASVVETEDESDDELANEDDDESDDERDEADEA